MGRVTIFPHFYLQNKLTDITEILLAIFFVNIFIIPTFAKYYSNTLVSHKN